MGEVAKRLLDGTAGYPMNTKILHGSPARRYPQRTAVNIAVRMALIWPAVPATQPEYIKSS
ncbi:hypothetical protein BIZ78_gp075 [Erwinia phage vB_EamM_Caitlin]|uniref:hypothetical protein n=1 Tax=Erwinia phage vB_EamM_Caitlin TaxID=1883379 RepID=UPI00081CBC03|nr:hypothetical protein BIZ78_gp075 [Erwinia phage vB_EamM_Caitlin]ANZ48500.1 hypothetical protein CAITLIN_205 [Erwinia phage vB_EamM_Caitlin]